MTTPPLAEINENDFTRLLADRLADERFPLRCQWELTCRCNLHCIMCYTDPFNVSEQIRQELSTDEIVAIMDELEEAGCLELCLTGGEPLARPDFLEIYTAAKERGFLVTIFTNGTLITTATADHLAAYPPKMVEISFHGLTQPSFDRITAVPGSFERCGRGIELLMERHIPLTLKSLGMTVNRDEVLAIKAWVESLGQAQYKVSMEMRPLLDGSDGSYEYELSEEEIAGIVAADPQLREEQRLWCEALESQPVRCGGGGTKFHIDAYGQLQLCSNNRRRGYDLRRGSFREGFWERLPGFPCPMRRGDRGMSELEVAKAS